ncbi:MAG: GNAT family N-acetyltransferase [Ferroplasma sp.]
MEIRPYNENDINEIYRVEQQSFGNGAYSLLMIRRMLHIPESLTLVVTVNNHVKAYATALPEGTDSIDIESIAVLPERQHMGYGSALITALESEAFKRGYREIFLEVREKNTNAIAFYKKHNYTVIDFIFNYYHLSFNGSRNAYRMSKILE